MRKNLIKSIIVGVGVTLMSACSKDKVQVSVSDANCPDTILFNTEVKPIFNQNCSTSGCHDAAGASAGIVLNNHQNISTFADQSFGAMRHDAGFNPMPLGSNKLADSLIAKVECWIAQGKQNN